MYEELVEAIKEFNAAIALKLDSKEVKSLYPYFIKFPFTRLNQKIQLVVRDDKRQTPAKFAEDLGPLLDELTHLLQLLQRAKLVFDKVNPENNEVIKKMIEKFQDQKKRLDEISLSLKLANAISPDKLPGKDAELKNEFRALIMEEDELERKRTEIKNKQEVILKKFSRLFPYKKLKLSPVAVPQTDAQSKQAGKVTADAVIELIDTFEKIDEKQRDLEAKKTRIAIELKLFKDASPYLFSATKVNLLPGALEGLKKLFRETPDMKTYLNVSNKMIEQVNLIGKALKNEAKYIAVAGAGLPADYRELFKLFDEIQKLLITQGWFDDSGHNEWDANNNSATGIKQLDTADGLARLKATFASAAKKGNPVALFEEKLIKLRLLPTKPETAASASSPVSSPSASNKRKANS